MVEVISKNDKGFHGTKVVFELNPQYFNNLDTSFDVRLLRQYLQDIAMTNPGLTVNFKYRNFLHKQTSYFLVWEYRRLQSNGSIYINYLHDKSYDQSTEYHD